MIVTRDRDYLIFGIEVFIAYAFINYTEKRQSRFLEVSKIGEYATKVIENMNKKGIKACLEFSEYSGLGLNENFFTEYSNYFKKVIINDIIYIELVEGVENVDLWNKFLTCMSFEIVMSLRNPDNDKVLFE